MNGPLWLVLYLTGIYYPSEAFRPDDLPPASAEARLVQSLESTYVKYGTIARPVLDASDNVTVELYLRLIKLDIDEIEQTMKTSVWMYSRWIDPHLTWDPEDYEGLDVVVLPWESIWTPEIALVNTADTEVNIRQADIMVSSTGGVVWGPHRMFTSACLIDVTNFPYDTHTCDMWFQAMSTFTHQMDLQVIGWKLDTYLKSYKESHTWQIVGNYTERTTTPDGNVKYRRRVSARFSLRLSRHAGYTGKLLMVPCVLLGATTLVIFCLPPDRPDRITLAMSLLGSFLVLLLILVETAPPSANAIPILGIYYACIMMLIMASPFLSGLVVNISHRGDYREPPGRLALMIIEILSWPLLIHDRYLYIQQLLSESEMLDQRHLIENGREHRQSAELNDVIPGIPEGECQTPDSDHQPSREQEDRYMRRKLSKIHIGLVKLLKRPQPEPWKTKKMNDPIYLQWRLLSQILDRICFVLYAIVLVLSYIFFFPKST